jgi:HSP20 family molecular chaperone IbpA
MLIEYTPSSAILPMVIQSMNMPLNPQIKTDHNGDYFFFPPGELAGSPHLAAADEGQLAVDIFETPTELIVQSTIAGVRLDDLELSLHNDFLTIRGKREHEAPKNARPLFSECYWGPFSRSIILPVEVRGDEATAILRSGVLTITLPKRHRSTIPVKEIE